MLIVPAIDLKEGRCVRLLKGRFDAVTEYGDPFAQLAAFEAAGAAWVHIVDLDGARLRQPAQYGLIARLAASTKLKIQCGGGVRARAHVEALLAAGAARVVVGSMAATQPEEVRAWLAVFGLERIVLALDVRANGEGAYEVAVNGWAEGAGRTLEAVLENYPPGAVRHILVTDVSQDGTLAGPNVALMQRVAQARGDLSIQASGGVGELADVRAVRAAGAGAVIVGRALYERRFSLEAALAC